MADDRPPARRGRLGATRQALNNPLNGHSGISPGMAARLSKAFGGSPQVWLGMQMQYDLAQAMKSDGRIEVTRLTKAA